MFKTAFHLVIAVAISQGNSRMYLFSPAKLEGSLEGLALLAKRLCNLEELC